MIQLTVIVPVYNVGSLLTDCVQSLLRLPVAPGSLEILIVNDGSTDDTGEIARRIALAHTCIRLIEQPNRGLAAARNAALAEARGTYLWFVDGDDYVEAAGFGTLLEFLRSETPDILAFQMATGADRHGNYRALAYPALLPGEACTGREAMRRGVLPASACNALYRRDFLTAQDLCFNPCAYREDVEFTGRAWCLARKVAYLPVLAYYYYTRPGSITQERSLANRLRLLRAELTIAASFLRFARQYRSLHPWVYPFMRERTNMILFNMLLALFRDRTIPYEEGLRLLADSEETGLYPFTLRYGTWKHRLMWSCLNGRALYCMLLKRTRIPSIHTANTPNS